MEGWGRRFWGGWGSLVETGTRCDGCLHRIENECLGQGRKETNSSKLYQPAVAKEGDIVARNCSLARVHSVMVAIWPDPSAQTM